MATRAAEIAAKEEVFQRIAKEFGTDTVGIYDKKLYINITKDGSPVQIAISLTCPKIPMGAVGKSDNINFEDTTLQEVAPTKFAPAEYTPEERQTVENLMEALGL